MAQVQTSPPSVGNRIKLNPLDYSVNSVAYNSGYIDLGSVEPSLGVPTGITLTDYNSSYYFPIFGISNSYLNSRKFTGNDSLVFKNKNLGINNNDPQYNIDIVGSFKTDNAYIRNLSVNYIVGNGQLNINYPRGVVFNNTVNFYANTYATNLCAYNITANNFYTDNLVYKITDYEIYQLNSAEFSGDLSISGSLTAANVNVTNSISSNNLSANNAFIINLGTNELYVGDNVLVKNNIYADKIFGKINIDPNSQLYYNTNNQLGISQTKDYYFVVRPSDSYSTDDINILRNTTNVTDGGYEQSYVLKPYFKNIQAVIDYVYTNNIVGNSLTIWIDEDINAGEDKENSYTPDNSGQYSGCTVTGNISSAFFSTNHIRYNYPGLYATGIRGGDFIWNKNTNADISGEFFYIRLYPIKFNNIKIEARYEIGSIVNSDNSIYYTTWRPFNYPPRKITFNTYICSDPTIPFGTLDGTTNVTWQNVYTKTYVQGRQCQFLQSQTTNLTLNNLCFEFNTNSPDSGALLFMDGNSTISNCTVALLGTGVYSYGAVNIESEYSNVNIAGTTLTDPYYVSQYTWNAWTSFGYSNPNYFPGYGLAIIGNPSPNPATILNYTESNPYTGFINVRDGAKLKIADSSSSGREIGHGSYLLNSLILDGAFNVSCFYNLDDRASASVQTNVFRTNNFSISSNYILYNNRATNDTFLLSKSNNYFNFKYVNFSGSFASFNILNNSFSNWTFRLQDAVGGATYNTLISINNNAVDNFYVFYDTVKPLYAKLTNSVNSLGYYNSLKSSDFNTADTIYYTSLYGIKLFNEYGVYSLNSPTLQLNSGYILNFYTPSG